MVEAAPEDDRCTTSPPPRSTTSMSLISSPSPPRRASSRARKKNITFLETTSEQKDVTLPFSKRRKKTNPSVVSSEEDDFETDHEMGKRVVFKEDHEDLDPTAEKCRVCQSACASRGNPIIFCDGCDTFPVHQECFIILDVPENEWFCHRCTYRTTLHEAMVAETIALHESMVAETAGKASQDEEKVDKVLLNLDAARASQEKKDEEKVLSDQEEIGLNEEDKTMKIAPTKAPLDLKTLPLDSIFPTPIATWVPLDTSSPSLMEPLFHVHFAIVCQFLYRFDTQLGLEPLTMSELATALMCPSLSDLDALPLRSLLTSLLLLLGCRVSGSIPVELAVARAFRKYHHQIDSAWTNPFEQLTVEFDTLTLSSKLYVLNCLCDWQFNTPTLVSMESCTSMADAEEKEEGENVTPTRRERPLGQDRTGAIYWLIQSGTTEDFLLVRAFESLSSLSSPGDLCWDLLASHDTSDRLVDILESLSLSVEPCELQLWRACVPRFATLLSLAAKRRKRRGVQARREALLCQYQQARDRRMEGGGSGWVEGDDGDTRRSSRRTRKAVDYTFNTFDGQMKESYAAAGQRSTRSSGPLSDAKTCDSPVEGSRDSLRGAQDSKPRLASDHEAIVIQTDASEEEDAYHGKEDVKEVWGLPPRFEDTRSSQDQEDGGSQASEPLSQDGDQSVAYEVLDEEGTSDNHDDDDDDEDHVASPTRSIESVHSDDHASLYDSSPAPGTPLSQISGFSDSE